MDFYHEAHSYTLAHHANIESDSDEESSWVMLNREGEIVKLPHEKIFYKVRSRIGLEVSSPKSIQNITPFSVKSDSGIVYITNERVIYIPARPTDTFQSFSGKILAFQDSRIHSSLFGPWTWTAEVNPTAGGGIPGDIPRLELKLIFREGGHDAFVSKFTTIKERLVFARQLREETGQNIPTSEELPQYEPRQGEAGSSGQAAGSGSSGRPADASQETSQPSQIPDEPPPDYEEAQAQAVGESLEERLRSEAERR